MFKIDYWYNDNPDNIASATICYRDLDNLYSGNIIDNNGKYIGDYVGDDSVIIEKYFKEHYGIELFG